MTALNQPTHCTRFQSFGRHLLTSLVVTGALCSAAPTMAQSATAKKAPPKVTPPAPYTPPVPRQILLPTGMRFAFVPRPGTRLIDVSLVFENAGAAFETGAKGATAMAADLLLDGTRTKTATELSNAIALLGANIGADCGILTCRVTARAPVNRAEELMTLLFEVVAAPRFSQADLERKKAEKAAYFASRKDDPQAISSAAVGRVLYGDHPLALDSEGTPESVAALTRDDVVAAWKQAFNRRKARLIIAADANVVDMIKLSVNKSGALAAGHGISRPSLPQAPAMDSKAGVIVIDKPGAAQSVVVVAGRAPAGLRPLTPNVKAFETLFGGSFTSRLNQNLREKNGYAYGARFGINHIDKVNPWRVSTSVATKDTGPAVAEIAKEMARIQTPATDEEVKRATTYRALTFPDAFATGGDIVSFFAWAARVGVSPMALSTYGVNLLAVDKAGVQEAAKSVLGNGPHVFVIVGDRAKIEAPLKEAAEAQKLGAIVYKSIDDVF